MKSSLKTLFSYFISLAIISSTPLHSREFEALRDEHGQPVNFLAIKSPVTRINIDKSCSATWLSSDGLILTNIHCIDACLIMHSKKVDIPHTINERVGDKPHHIYQLDVTSLNEIQCTLSHVFGLKVQVLSLGARAWIPPEDQASFRKNYKETYEKLTSSGVNGINGPGDFALLKIVPSGNDQAINLERGRYFSYPPSCLNLSSAPLVSGQDIWGFSYPLIERPGFKIENNEYSPLVTKGMVIDRKSHPIFPFEAINDYFGKDQETFFASTDAESGSSGSPLFDKNGDVVGIVYATLNPSHAYNEGSTLAIPVQTMLQAFTRDLGEDFTHNLLHNTCTRSPDTDKIMQLILKI